MAEQKKLNGSADLLADAMRKVFTEAVEAGVAPVRDDMARMEGRLREDVTEMEGRLHKRIDTTNENMAAQFAAQEQKIGKLIKGRPAAK